MINTDDRKRFIEAEYSPIPLKPNSKEPQVKGWQKKLPYLQWKEAGENCNIGLRAGRGKGFIDCDDKNQVGTFHNVLAWLNGLGHKTEDLPIVQTASGVGRQIYVNFRGSLFGSKRNLIPSMGAGEFRYDYGAYVATFPSIVDQVEYKLLQGDIYRLPILDIKDVASLIPLTSDITVEKRRPAMSPLALAIARGEILNQYKTASEAEAGLVLSLINSGYDYLSIKNIFEAYPCQGHFKNKHTGKDRDRWLSYVYQEMLKFSKNESATRKKITGWIELAQGIAWSRTTDKNILLAHLKKAFSVGRYEYGLDMRTVSLSAGVGLDAVSRGTRRIVNTGLLEVLKPGQGARSTIYKLEVSKCEHILTEGVLRICSDIDTLRDYAEVEKISQHDAFANGKGRLGRRAGDIYELLFVVPLTVKDISTMTGACKNTVKSALKKLRSVKDRKTGEIIEMVTLEGNKWHSNIVDLELVAAIMGTYGAAGKQEEIYKKDRRLQAKKLELNSIKKDQTVTVSINAPWEVYTTTTPTTQIITREVE